MSSLIAQKADLVINRHLFYYYFLAILLVFSSCSDSRSDQYELLVTSSPFDFHSVELYKGQLFASGGDVWNKSNLAISQDGRNWKIDSLTNKSIFDLYTDGKTLFGVGNDGYIFSGQPDLQLTRTKFWGLLRAFTSSEVGFVAAGGKDFNKGWIYKVTPELQVDTTHFFENEILDVHCTNSGYCIACGYGLILISNDYGASWNRSDENGDYYNSIATNSRDEIFIVGYNGTIINSTDHGENWEKIKNGHSPLANNKPFRAIKFKAETGVIVGDNGLIWISQNDGKNWNDMSIDTDLDIFDFVFFQSKIICVSESGQILSIAL
jgi:hypothetical protein